MLSKSKNGPLLLICFIFFFSCNEKTSFSDVAQVEEVRIREVGQKATNKLLKTLQKELKSTITNKGMLAALSVCNYKAINLTDSISHTSNDIIEIKRTSFKYRNPKNAPDVYDMKALNSFQSALFKTGRLPEDMIKMITEGSEIHYRYYKPLMMKPLCINCHGKTEMLSPDLLYRIKQLYPSDNAIGYKIDQFRGVLRVSIK